MNKLMSVKLSDLVDIVPSNVDKKIFSNEEKVRLCNYMDVYRNRYLTNKIDYSVGSVTVPEKTKFSLLVNDVIITKDSETPDDIAVPSVVIEQVPDLVCGYHLALLRPKKDTCDGSYLMHLIQTSGVKIQFSNKANGSTRYGLTLDSIRNIKLTVPIFEIQKKVAKILSTIDGQIEKTEAIIAKYQAIKQGMLQDLFTRGIDVKTGKLRPRYEEAPELYKESLLGLIPKEWEVLRIDELVNSYAGGTPNRSKPEYFQGNIPWICSSEVNQSSVSWTNEKITEAGFKYSSVKWVPKDSVLVAMYGATAGQVSYLNIRATTNQAVLALVPKEGKIDSRYLYYLLNLYRDKILYFAQGSGQPNLNKQMIDRTLVSIPPNLVDQLALAKILANINTVIEDEMKDLDKLEEIKEGLMDDLLTGKVEVTV